MSAFKWLVLVGLILFGYYQCAQRTQAPTEAAVDVPSREVRIDDNPLQIATNKYTPFQQAGYEITPLAEFHLSARVLARANYSSDREAQLSPVDLALGWGPMAKPENLKSISISQSRRFYLWQVPSFHIPRSDIELHSANMHLIPADQEVMDAMQQVKPGQTVRIHGLLVQAVHPDGWSWRSSMTRSDTGHGACELIWVRRLVIED